MTPAEPPDPSTPAETLDYVLHHLLPILITAALSVKSFIGRWRPIHSNLSNLLSSLSEASSSPHWSQHPLLLPLLPALLSTLRSLYSLSARCVDASPPADRLRLQSDLDAAAAALAFHLRDLGLLLRTGLLHHSVEPANAIVLPLPGPGASRADLELFSRDIFARLQIGAPELKHSALESLLQFLSSDPSKLSPLVVREGDPAALVRLLLDPNSVLRDQAAAAVSILTTASDISRKALFEEGVLGPLLRLLENGSVAVKEHAAKAIEAITADPANAWAVSAYGGVPVLIDACRHGGGVSPSVRAFAAGALKNVSGAGDARLAMAEEGAVPVFIDLILSGNAEAQKSAAFCLWALASMGGEEVRLLILQEGGLKALFQLLREGSNPELNEHGLKAMHAIAASGSAARVLSASSEFFTHLAELIKNGQTTAAQQEAAAVLCELSPSEESKKAMAGCMGTLVKMMEAPKPAGAQEAAACALASLLATRANRRALARDEKSLTRLVQMLDPGREEVCKKFPVAVVLALAAGGGGGVRRRLTEAGACHHLQKLADAEVPGAKKALQRIAGGRLKNLFSMGWRE